MFLVSFSSLVHFIILLILLISKLDLLHEIVYFLTSKKLLIEKKEKVI